MCGPGGLSPTLFNSTSRIVRFYPGPTCLHYTSLFDSSTFNMVMPLDSPQPTLDIPSIFGVEDSLEDKPVDGIELVSLRDWCTIIWKLLTDDGDVRLHPGHWNYPPSRSARDRFQISTMRMAIYSATYPSALSDLHSGTVVSCFPGFFSKYYWRFDQDTVFGHLIHQRTMDRPKSSSEAL